MKKTVILQRINTCLFFTCLLIFATGCKKDETTKNSLTVGILPVSSGTVSLSPSGNTYEEGVEVTLTPKPGVGYKFESWSGVDASYIQNDKIVMSKNMEVIANFSLNLHTISVSVNPQNSGTVNGAGTYSYGQNVLLTATPAIGYTFTDWTENGIPISTNSTYSFTANSNRILVANFTIISFTIVSTVNPLNSGTITGAGTYNYGQTVTLTATPAVGYAFTNWTENGTIVSTNTVYSFTANSNRALVANFELSTMIRLQSGSGLNYGSQIYFVALSKNTNYFNLSSDDLFAYSKTNADWYIDGDIIPFTSNYKDFNLTTGVYYFLVSGSGTVMVTTITVIPGKQTFLIYGRGYGLGVNVLQNGKSVLLFEEKSCRIINYKR